MTTETRSPRIELYTRAAMPGTQDRQERVLSRLEELSASDAITGYGVHTWEGRVRVRSSTDGELFPLQRLRTFERWAEAADVSLDPFFDRTVHRSSFTDESFEEVTFPVLCLTVVEDGSVRTVAPHRRNDSVYSVEDCLVDLGASEFPENLQMATAPAEE